MYADKIKERATRRNRYAATRERNRALKRKWRAANADKERARNKQYRLSNAEYLREYRRRYHRKHYIPKLYDKVCRHCNSVFQAKQSRTKFCSSECAYCARPKNLRQKKVCVHCNSIFMPKQGKRFCSKKCRVESYAIRYPDRLKTAKRRSMLWSRRRNHIAAQILRELIGREKANDLIRHIAFAH